MSICRECDRLKSRAYYAANRETRLAKMKARNALRETPLRMCASCGVRPSCTSRHWYCYDCREIKLALRATRRYNTMTEDQVARARERERKRQSVTKRGYGRNHVLLRERWKSQVAAGLVDCARCGQRIAAGEPWDLGHVDGSRTLYAGPEHRACNRATAGRKRKTSRTW